MVSTVVIVREELVPVARVVVPADVDPWTGSAHRVALFTLSCPRNPDHCGDPVKFRKGALRSGRDIVTD